MPIFFQQPLSDTTRIGVWKIEETEDFFKGNVPVHRAVTHPHKRLQHLAGRFLLQFLFPDFPYELIQIADTRKPYLPDEQYHFSISHCGDYAAAIVSKDKRVGIDIEIPVEAIDKIMHKFLSANEHTIFHLIPLPADHSRLSTLLWSAKEAVFKWHGNGGVDFRRHIQLQRLDRERELFDCFFAKTKIDLQIHYKEFEQLCLTWVIS